MDSGLVNLAGLDSFSSIEEAIQRKMDRTAWYLGPIILASLVDIFLLGTLCTSFCSYWRSFNDKFKLLVSALFLINLAQSITVIWNMWTMFGSGFGDWNGTLSNIFFEAILITEALSGSLSQLFFLERAYTLLKSPSRSLHRRLLVAVCTLGILAGLSLGLSSGIITALLASNSTDFANFEVLDQLIIAWKSISAGTDLIITGTLIACLLERRGLWKDTNDKISSLVRWIVEAQTLPLVCSLFFLITYAVEPAANICLIPSFAEGKLAAISVLHVLNSRGHFGQEASDENAKVSSTSKGNPLSNLGRIAVQTETFQVISERDLAIDFERQEEWNRDVTDAGLFSLKVDNASSETLDDARIKAESSRGTSLEAGQSKQVEVKPFEEMIW
ncbi:hypothetical protein BDY24DRAFT_35302 [Mrakia frigida]|uniref:DUF6534 domain-containing protein n=1 Tax=Mrakia frigida TaxID=29902 RepID=UPI003FCC1A6F